MLGKSHAQSHFLLSKVFCLVGKTRHQNDAEEVKRCGQTWWWPKGVGKGSPREHRVACFFAIRVFSQVRFSGRMETLILSGVLDAFLHTGLNPQGSVLGCSASYATPPQS